MTLSQLSASLRSRLAPALGERESAAVVRFIFEQVKGWDAVQLAIRAADPVSDFVIEKTNAAADRVLAGEPVQYVFGRADFYGMQFSVTRDTLIPRPETALMVDLIVKEADGRPDLRVLDLGTGSGCIAIALARNLRFADVTALDISEGALSVARANAADLRARVRFARADMLDPAAIPAEPYDIIVSNPPYIAESEKVGMEDNVLLHEPHTALFVPDSDPLLFYKAIARIARQNLTPGGRLWLEINPLFSRQLADMLKDNDFINIEIIKDMEGRDRFACATQPDNV